MSILRIVTNPADIGAGGYTWDPDALAVFDPERVDGAFELNFGEILFIPHNAPAATETWYHWRHAQSTNTDPYWDSEIAVVRDAQSNTIAEVRVDGSDVFVRVINDNSTNSSSARVSSGAQQIGRFTPYSFDLHVIVDSTITARFYINGALYGEVIIDNVNNYGVGRNISFSHGEAGDQTYVSELIIADEDTRGMRIREMRPKSFGIFQEWDGAISALRDTDLATGISTDVPDSRVSFGVSNIEHIKPGDIINRVVAQSYAQRGETGLSGFNFFFRHRDGTVTDGAEQTLSVLGDYFSEEYATNPLTGEAWKPEDFASLQTGIQSKA